MKRRFLIAPTLMIAGLGLGGYSWLQSPSSTTNADYGSKPASKVLSSETSMINWHTAYFETEYPSSLRIRTAAEDSTKTVIGSYMLSSVVPQQEDQVGVTIATMGNNTLAAESAIKYRSLHPELYKRSSRSYAPPGSYVFDGIGDVYESGIFWQSGDRYSSVDVTGSSARRLELEQALQTIVANWRSE